MNDPMRQIGWPILQNLFKAGGDGGMHALSQNIGVGANAVK